MYPSSTNLFIWHTFPSQNVVIFLSVWSQLFFLFFFLNKNAKYATHRIFWWPPTGVSMLVEHSALTPHPIPCSAHLWKRYSSSVIILLQVRLASSLFLNVKNNTVVSSFFCHRPTTLNVCVKISFSVAYCLQLLTIRWQCQPEGEESKTETTVKACVTVHIAPNGCSVFGRHMWA